MVPLMGNTNHTYSQVLPHSLSPAGVLLVIPKFALKILSG